MGFAVYINLHSRQGEVVTTNIYKIVLLKIEKNVYYKINFYDESKKKSWLWTNMKLFIFVYWRVAVPCAKLASYQV